MNRSSRWVLALGTLGLVAYFFSLSHGGLQAYFTGDDAMNLVHLHGTWQEPWWHLARDAALVVTPTYRPAGGLWYRTLYAAVGLDPLPFRVFCYLLLGLNGWLAWRILRSLSGSRETAFLGVLLWCYHGTYQDLYYNSGTVYDLLCFLFYGGTMLAYNCLRSAGQWRSGWALAALLLYAAALGSKEMAVTLPVVLVLLELADTGLLRRQTQGAWPRWALLAAMSGIAVAFLAAKTLAAGAMASNDLYRPRPSLAFYLESCRHYADLLTYQTGWWTVPRLLALWGGMAAVALLLRQRALWLGLLFFLLTIAPVALIPPRAGFVLYLPTLGLALYAAVLLVWLRSRLAGLFAPFRPVRWLASPAIWLLLAGALGRWHAVHGRELVSAMQAASRTSRQFMAQLAALRPAVEPGSWLYFADDPYPANDYTLLFLLRLQYHDPVLLVERGKLHTPDGEPEPLPHQHRFTYAQQRLAELPIRVSASPAPVAVRFEPSVIRRGQSYTLTVPGYAHQSLDVTFNLQRGQRPVSAGVVRNWCTLDGQGQARLSAPPDQPLMTVAITRLRSHNTAWVPAQGSITVK